MAQMEVTSHQRAGVGPRLAAGVFDLFTYAALLVTEAALLMAIFAAWDRTTPQAGDVGPQFSAAMIVFIVIWHLMVLGLSAMEIFVGKTFGKAVVGLKIASADGGRASGGALTVRWAIKNSPLILLLVVLIPASVVWPRPGAVFNVIGWVVAALGVAVLAMFFFAARSSLQALYDSAACTAVFRRRMPGQEHIEVQ